MKGGFAFAQSVGKRDNQEDAAAVVVGEASFSTGGDRETSGSFSSSISAVVCDGMGGHTSGEVAAKLACDGFLETCRSIPAEDANPDQLLYSACLHANELIARAVASDPSFDGMGTTFVAVHVHVQLLHWLSVGDSHVFLLRGRRLVKLNQDHSMRPVIEAMVQQGLLAPGDALRHPDRNALRSSLMGDPLELVDHGVGGFTLQPNDIVILASDGLDVVAVDGIVRRLRPRCWSGDLANRTRRVVEEADRIGGVGQDNTTVVVIHIAKLAKGPGRMG